MSAHRRGNALITVMVALAVLLTLVVAAINFTGSNRESASAKGRADQLAACAQAAKRTLLAQLKVYNISVTDLSLNARLPDGTTDTSTEMLTGHYSSTAPEPTIVKLESSAMGQSRRQLRDMSNTIAQTTLGGSYYRVVARCRSRVNGAESEVEFTFRHGI